MKNNKYNNVVLSEIEKIKRNSNFLRGTIACDLEDELTGGFSGDNYHLIKFHGMYQQDDRDLRLERKKQKLEPLINMMLRCRLPGGLITSKQWLHIDKFVNHNTIYNSIRITSRQTFQLHGLFKRKLKLIHALLHTLGLDSIATAGDVNRNVVCTSNPMESLLHYQVLEWSKKLSEYLLPKTRAYIEIWLDGEKLQNYKDDEPILSNVYLPRKFKIAVAIPPINDVDVHANDLSFIAISHLDKLVGFNVLVGGGLAMTYGDLNTYPRIASEFGYIALQDTLQVAKAIVMTQRDWGNRSNRKYSKTKYTLRRVGVEVFKNEVEMRSGIKFAPIRYYCFTERGDRFGWMRGIDKKWYLTLFIENGRITDMSKNKLKTCLSKIASIHNGNFLLTANQNLIVSAIDEDTKPNIDTLVKEYGLIHDNFSLQRKYSMACVSFPTCPLAMAESERFLPNFISKLEKIMLDSGSNSDSIVLRVSGCPNGCSRVMLSEIGLVGRSVGHYNLYLGGDRIGTRIPRLYRENVTEDEILDILKIIIFRWVQERHKNEYFGDYVIRVGIIKPVINSEIDFYN